MTCSLASSVETIKQRYVEGDAIKRAFRSCGKFAHMPESSEEKMLISKNNNLKSATFFTCRYS